MRPLILISCSAFFLSLALFGSTLCLHLPPGNMAYAVASQLGAIPFAPVESPVWGLWVRACAFFLNGHSTFAALNGGNALLGALAVALTAWLCARIPHDRSHEEKRSQLEPRRAAWISGLTAAAVLATTPTFWFSATRACPEILGICLLMWAAILWLRALERDQFHMLYPGCLLVGLGCVEFATFWLALPLFAALVVAHALRRRSLKWGRILACLGCFCLGYSLIFYAARMVHLSPSAPWRGYEGYGDSLWAVFRQQKVLLLRSLPRVGWLLIFLVSLAPLLMTVLPKERLQRSTRWPSYFLHATLSALALLMLFNSWISPYGQFKFHILVVTPCVFNAIWIGYLAGYWWCVFHSRSRLETGAASALKRVAARIWPPVLAGLLLVVGWRSHQLVAPRHTAWTDAYADYLLARLPDNALFASETPVSHVVALKAWQKGKIIRLLSPRYSGVASYVGYMGSLWTQPRLRSLAQVGALPMVAEWIKLEPAEASAQYRSDFFDSPIHGVGWEPIPTAPFYSLQPNLDGVDAAALSASLDEWAGQPFMRDALEEKHPDAYQELDQWLRVSAAKFANNLGVLAERLDRPELAETRYRLARRWNPDNPSALLNLSDLSLRHPPSDAKAIATELETFLAGMKGRFSLFSLSHVHGVVSRPDAFVQRGLAWAVSGRPTLAAGEIRRAMQLTQHDEHLRLLLAFLQFEDADSGGGEPILREILGKDPGDVTALAALARIQASRGDMVSARASLARALERQPKSPTLRLQQVGLEILADDLPAGMALLKQLTRESTDNLQAWALLALLAHQTGNEDLVANAESHLAKRDDLTTAVRLVLADLRRRRRDFSSAKDILETALARDRGNPAVHEQLLRVLYLDRDRHRAREVVRDLLRLDPSHAFANLMQGSLQYEDGDLEFAEASFRASIRTQPSAEALNSLAFILAQKGRHADALPLAEQAKGLQPRDPAILDTLAVIHLGMSHLDPALELSRQAVALAPEDAEIALHLAQILDARGERKEALSICNDLFNRIGQVPPRLQTTLTDLRARLERAVGSGA